METIVKTEELQKQFGSILAVNDLNISLPAGEIYGLLGPNGSGKTTLIRLIVGLLKPTKGKVTVLGQRMPNKKILSQVGYMPQAKALYEDLTIKESITFFSGLFGAADKSLIDEVIELVDLQDRANSLVGTLSGGMKQRTSLACALIHKPRILLLDEPTVGVDPQLRNIFWSYFRQLADEGVLLIISSHVMDEAEKCDRLGFIRLGKLIAEGSVSELLSQTNTQILEEAFLRFSEISSNGEE